MKEELNSKLEEANAVMDQMDDNQGKESCVKVESFAYPGTKITVNETSIVLSKPVQHGRFVKDGADIRVKGL